MTKLKNAFSPTRATKIRQTSKGSAGYDNARENIDPHVKTKVLDTKELIVDGVNYTPGAVEGTAVLSTGELGATKFLREDGDDSCSWQSPAGGGDVTAAVNLTDVTLVQGDGGAKGIKTTTITTANVTTLTDNSMADTLHRHSELSASDGAPDQALTVDANGRVNIAYDFSVDTNLLFVDIAGNIGVGIGTGTPSEMLDVVGNAEINGNIIVTGTVDGINIATDVAANTTHAADNTQAHTDYLLNSGADSSSGKITAAGFDAGSSTIDTTGVTTTGDHVTPATDQVVNVCFGTGAAPAANTTTIGSLYITYTA